jgi:hypothetical protein
MTLISAIRTVQAMKAGHHLTCYRRKADLRFNPLIVPFCMTSTLPGNSTCNFVVHF